MPVTINGTTGIAGVDGSASTPSVQGSDTNTGVFYPAADTVAVGTGGSERMRIDSSGNVGIGTTNVNSKFVVSNGGAAGLEIQPTGFSSAPVIVSYNRSGAAYTQLTLDGASNVFAISGTERMRIDSSGNLLVGTTTSSISSQSGTIQVGLSGGAYTRQTAQFFQYRYSSSAGLPCYTANWSSTNYWGIGPDSGSNDSTMRLGIVSIDASGSYWSGYANVKGGTYTNASDYRLKENVINYADGALSKVLSLRPVNYNVIPIPHEDKDGPTPVVKTEVGFIAHELQEHIPELVYGEKDALNIDGSPNMQSVDYAKLTAVLVKAIQELSAKVDAQAAEIVELKAKIG